MDNPKLRRSCLMDCIPQTGPCPNDCPECFYNGGHFYRPLDEALLPEVAEARGKIVRMNSGNDSNHCRDIVIAAANVYLREGIPVFFNTSLPRFDFPAPVVFTCNGRWPNEPPHLVQHPPANLMFVRCRTNIWDEAAQDEIVAHYTAWNVPVVMTFMRYYSRDAIAPEHAQHYEWRRHLLNPYWCATRDAVASVMARYAATGVRMCGTPSSNLCVDCRNCEFLYWECVRRMQT